MSAFYILYEVMYLGLFLLFLLFPKYELCRKINLSILRLTKSKARLPFSASKKYLIPAYNSKSLCDMLGIKLLGKLFIPSGVLVALLFMLTTIFSWFLDYLHPYLVLYIHIAYWASIGIFLILEILLAGYVSYLFGKKGCMFLAIIPPISNMVLATGIPTYFKENKDQLTGAFEVAEDAG